MDNSVSDKWDSISTMIQSVQRTTTVTETITQSLKQAVAQKDYEANKKFLVVIANCNENVLTRNNNLWNSIMSSEYSEDGKRDLIRKEIWPQLKAKHWIFSRQTGPCQRELEDAIINLAGRPAPMVEGSRREKGFGPGVFFAHDLRDVEQAEEQLRNQKAATSITADDKNKTKLKLGRKPHTAEGTQVVFEGEAILCDVLFGDNVFSGPIKSFSNKMMEVTDLFFQSRHTEAEWMEKIGNPSIYALWDCFNQGFSVKLTKEDVFNHGRYVNLGALVHTMATFKKQEVPSALLLPEYFQPARGKSETQSEDLSRKRSPPPVNDINNRELQRLQKQQRRQGKYEKKEYTTNLPNDVKKLIDDCLDLNKNGAKPAYTTEWIRDFFGVSENKLLKKKLNINSNNCHVLSLFGRCNRNSPCKFNHKNGNDYDQNEYKKCCEAFIKQNSK